MTPLTQRLSARVGAFREQHPALDHLVRTVLHYGERNGNAQAGAVTFFAFLSFFPILALAFFVVGYVSSVYPDVRGDVADALEQVLPGVVGDGDGEIPLSSFEAYAGTVGLIGLAGLLYSGLGWVSGMRRALEVMFRLPRREQPSLVVGKARDLLSLAVLGVVLLLSISLTGAMSWSSEVILAALRLEGSWLGGAVLRAVTHAVAIAATTLLLVAMFTLLAKPHVARRALWQGALAGAVGFEALKLTAGFLIAQTKEQPAFHAFGVALILVVWINYFSRLVMLSASWAYTAPVAQRLRVLEGTPLITPEEGESLVPAPATVAGEDPGEGRPPRERGRRTPGVAVPTAAGAAVAVLTWLLGRRRG